MRIQLLFSVIGVLLNFNVYAQDSLAVEVGDTLVAPEVLLSDTSIINDNPVELPRLSNRDIDEADVFTEGEIYRMDSMLVACLNQQYCFSSDRKLLNIYDFEKDSVPSLDAETLAGRLRDLDLQTPFDIKYNKTVHSFITHYTVSRQEMMGRMISLSNFYFPLFEQELSKHNLPLELKYLPVVESAFNNEAVSHAGAAGLWQFMYATGRAYGLRVTSYVDERLDPYKSTEAACAYLKWLYGLYDDWALALAAYNSGPGNVNKAIKRSGGKKNFWAIRSYLPRETRSYYPAFVAVYYTMNYPTEHNILPSYELTSFFDVDTVHVKEKISLKVLAKTLNMSNEEIGWLNPAYISGIVPEDGYMHAICLPSRKTLDFIAFEDEIKAKSETARQDPVLDIAAKTPKKSKKAAIPNTKPIYYTVRSGDVLGTIAENHGVRVSELKSWNGIRGTTIRVGQKLKVYPAENPKKAPNKTPEKNQREDGEFLYHTVRRGDTLWDIAKLYKGVSADNIKALNPGLNAKNLKLGAKIKIKRTA